MPQNDVELMLTLGSMEEFVTKRSEIEQRDLLKFRLAMGGEDPTKL